MEPVVPCRHIFERRCLLSTFQIGQEAPGGRRARCVACFREFLISLNRQSSPLPSWVASIENLVATAFRRYGTRWTPAVAAIFPFLIAVSVSMEIAAKVNIGSRHWFRWSPRWLRLMFAACGIAGWLLLICWLSYVTVPSAHWFWPWAWPLGLCLWLHLVFLFIFGKIVGISIYG
jgi:hypothetical protein